MRILRTLKARAFLDLLVFCGPSPPDCMRVVSGIVRGALDVSLSSHESSLRGPSDC
jgi:hypothetical protein